MLAVGLTLLAAIVAGCQPPAHQPEAKLAVKAPVVPPDPGLEFATERHAGKRFTVCRVDLTKHNLELFWRNGARRPFKGFATLDGWLRAKGRRLVFAMNAGMYQSDFSPVGLYVEHGKQLRPLNLSHGRGNFCLLPNGVFAVTDSGACVVESTEYPTIQKSAVLATQSGPMLVIEGRLHPAFTSGSQSRLIRNGVGVVSPRQVVFAISEDPVNFHEFATFFRDAMGCPNALYFDGSVSSLYSVALNRNDGLTDLGPMIGVTEAAK